ncbi:MAG: helix-turn-helix domain-containing protein [Alcaligenaceae bacterium]|nr:helix-turn-helix domain-containing protein [Alcaligenaceae bacterium]
MNLCEIGALVQSRRAQLGLTQVQLARMSGLSRATVKQLEGGTLKEVGVTKLLVLFDLLGLDMTTWQPRQLRHALQMASQSASVSYKTVMQTKELQTALVSGVVPASLVAHIATFLDETPLTLLVAAVQEASQRGRVPMKLIWRHLEQWAIEFQSPRVVWAK